MVAVTFKFVGKVKLGAWWETGRSLERGQLHRYCVSVRNNQIFVLCIFYQCQRSLICFKGTSSFGPRYYEKQPKLNY